MALNHYAALNVEPGASLADVKQAYRTQAKKLHPDTNRSADAKLEFQRLQEAYRVLRDPRLRIAYDVSRVTVPQTKLAFPEFGRQPGLRPFSCRFCGKPTAQPRYAIYWTVVSNLVYPIRWAKSGLFCVACARKAALRASLITATFGWWSLPGLVLAPRAMIRNAKGGERPRGADARLLWSSALLFYAKGDARLAKGLAKRLAGTRNCYSNFARNMVLFLDHLRPQEPGNLKDGWQAQRSDVWKHTVLAMTAPVAVTAAAILWIDASTASVAAAGISDAGSAAALTLSSWIDGVRSFRF